MTLSMDIIEFMKKFATEGDCLGYLREKRYKDFVCPVCTGQKFWMIESRKCMECAGCGRQEYLTAGTIFHKSSTPLTKWFYAIYMITHAKKGISAMQLQKMLGVTYKTAWRIAHKIREAMKDNDDDNDMFGGIVQVDEMYVPVKKNKSQGNSHEAKAVVAGAWQRKDDGDSQVHMEMITTSSTIALRRFIKKHVREGEEIHTDFWRGYTHLKREKYTHKKVNHSKYYVHDGVHIQGIESCWSLFKRGITGAYHRISRKWLPYYLAEFQFRFNNRKAASIFDLVLERV